MILREVITLWKPGENHKLLKMAMLKKGTLVPLMEQGMARCPQDVQLCALLSKASLLPVIQVLPKAGSSRVVFKLLPFHIKNRIYFLPPNHYWKQSE